MWTHLHLRLSTLSTKNISEKINTWDPTLQSTEKRQATALPFPQTSHREEESLLTVQRSKDFIKDKYITKQTELPPFELRERSVLRMKVPKIKSTFARPMTKRHSPRYLSMSVGTGRHPWCQGITHEHPKVQHFQAHLFLCPCPPTSPHPWPSSRHTSRRRDRGKEQENSDALWKAFAKVIHRTQQWI